MRLAISLMSLFLVACATTATAPPSPQLTLSAGSYRVEGTCISMVALSRDNTAQCDTYMGIVTDDPNKPSFVFPRKDKSTWLFFVSESASYSPDGNVAKYPVSSVIDSSENRAYDLPGECVLTVQGPPSVNCFVALKSGIKMREASFRGSGTWLFKRGGEFRRYPLTPPQPSSAIPAPD